jgi:hypothetical protein
MVATSIANLRMFHLPEIVERVIGYFAQHINRHSADELSNDVDDSKEFLIGNLRLSRMEVCLNLLTLSRR